MSGGQTRIVNNGIIDGFEGGIDHLGGNSLLINRGTIREAEFYGFSGAADSDEVRNSARSGVAYSWGATTTALSTAGSSTSSTSASATTSISPGVQGSAGRVDGRDGEDFFVGGRADDVFSGGTGGDDFRFARRGGDDRNSSTSAGRT